MNSLDKQYQDLLRDILGNGVKKQDRTGTGTLSLFGRQIRHKMSDGFPLLTTKKMAWNAIVSELQWFLSGSTDIRDLWAKNCHIWDGDYKKSGRTDFQLGPIYGYQWRKWQHFIPYDITEENCKMCLVVTDQIQNLINELKANPDSRRLMVSAWNVADLDKMVLPPCHFSWQCYSHEKDGKRYLSLAWNQRSVDTFLGLPFNIASYGLLLTMLADEVGMIPDELIGNLGDVHLYYNHIEQAEIQLTRDPYPLPTVSIQDGIYSNMPGDVEIIDYKFHPAIKAPLSN